MAKKKRNKLVSYEENSDESITTYEVEEIDEPSAEPVQEQVPIAVVPMQVAKIASPKVDFDAWFVMRGSKIPKHHHKEIIQADFKGRGLKQHESLEDFDAALRMYGINLV